jgi:hypothetical protein
MAIWEIKDIKRGSKNEWHGYKCPWGIHLVQRLRMREVLPPLFSAVA